jgi:hypothetical protein
MVRQRDGVEPVVMLGSQPIQLTQRNDRRRRDSRASTPKWEIEDSGFKLAVPSWPSATARPNGSKESPGALGGRVRIVHELDQARTGNGR